MKLRGIIFTVIVLSTAVGVIAAGQQVPGTISYQGRVMHGSTAVSGPGFFKFSICDRNETNTFWSNDGMGMGCAEPGMWVPVPVDKGIYQVILGDTTIPGMMSRISPAIFKNNSDLYLKVWFGDTVSMIEELAPKQPLTSVPYAMQAGGGGEPNVIIVDQMGAGDTTTITGGLYLAEQASAPTLVKVAPGVYTEMWLMVPKNVTLQCITPRSCVVDCMTGTGFDLVGSNIRIQGFHITNSWTALNIMGGGEKRENIDISDNRFTWCNYAVNVMGGSSVSDIYVRHNQFEMFITGMDASGVALVDARNVWIEDNVFRDFDGSLVRGVGIVNGEYVRIRHNQFQDFFGMPGMYASAVAIQDSSSVWVEDNSLANINGSPLAGVYCERCNSAHIRNNDISSLNVMFGGTTDGIRFQEGGGVWVEANNIRRLESEDATGIMLQDVGPYSVVNNDVRGVGDPWGWAPDSWGIFYKEQWGVMPGPPENNKNLIKDNRISDCDNGINVDYGMAMEMMPYSDKVIQGNLVLDGDSAGHGIQLVDALKVQVIDNKVMGFEKGLGASYMMVNPEPLHVMRNELWKNAGFDLEIMAMAGTVRVFYNFMDQFNRPGPAVDLLEAGNYDSTGETPP